ncbi:amidohydrolase [Niallia sp. FSL W8-0635]|uniref:amidohydrolase n=1 Tax=Niallia sp. FSL W8-0635 TaxID=2975337 RepID=UPI0030F6AC4A
MKASLVYLNGEIITVDTGFSVKEAVAVVDNKIVAVGSNEEIKTWIGEDTNVVDLGGDSLLPGFIDAHLHLLNFGLTKVATNLKPCKSIDETLELLKAKADETPAGGWIRGWAYNDNNVAENRMPNRKELDSVSTVHPIYVQRSCGHVIAANSKALEFGEITAETPNPAGGEIERVNGEVTGVLKEAARSKVLDKDVYTDEEVLSGLHLAAKDYIQSGITSVHDMGGKERDHLLYLQKVAKDPDFKMRVYASIVSFDNSSDAIDKTLDASILTGLGNEKFKIGPSKLFLDGSITGQTAAMSEGYVTDSDNKGILYKSQEEVNQIMERPHNAGCQITAHAIGDSAVELMVNCIEHVVTKFPRENHRHRIEHASVCNPELIQRIKKLNAIIVINPAFFYDFGDEYVKYIGSKAEWMFPSQSYLNHGVKVAAGSDSPITDFEPLLGIQEIVIRKTKNGTVIGEIECTSLEDAIRMFTINGAYASFEEEIKGSIEPGKLADFVVLEGSILNTNAEQIKDIPIKHTVINGEIVYGNEAAVVK